MEHAAVSKTKSSEGFIDGDLVEHFLDLPQEKMEQISKGIKVGMLHYTILYLPICIYIYHAVICLCFGHVYNWYEYVL